MTKQKYLIMIGLYLFFSLEGQAQDNYTMRPDSILQGRIQEYISLLTDYIGFINTKNKPNSTKQYYKKKACALFMPYAKAIIKSKDSKEQQALNIKIFFDSPIDSIKQYDLDSIQVPNWKSKSLILPDSILWIDSKVITIYKRTTFHFQDSIMLIRETTELGDEWRPLLGNLFLSYKQKKKTKK